MTRANIGSVAARSRLRLRTQVRFATSLEHLGFRSPMLEVFHGATDCTELDFQDIVLKRGYAARPSAPNGSPKVLVYPDASKKPPVGEGLNKASTVTMCPKHQLQ